MSIDLYAQPSVFQTSWIEMRENVAMNYEIDRRNDVATLFFGSRSEYVLNIGQENLDQLLDLCTAAKRELAAKPQ
jgi:hypothetical protein